MSENAPNRILIMGGGPIGMVAALLLAKKGIASIIFEKRKSLSESPQAHVLKQRSMEILRELGIEAEIRQHETKPEEMRFINWVNRLNGPEIASLDLWLFPNLLMQIVEGSPAMPGNLAQDVLEQILRRHVESDPLIEYRNHATVTRISQNQHRVTVEYSDAAIDGVSRSVEETGPYLIACDGASSAAREMLSIDMVGPDKLATVVMIHFEADLSAYMQHRPGVLFWNLDPDNGGNFIVYDLRRTHVYMHPYNEAVESYDSFSPERAKDIVHRAIGENVTPLKIMSVRPWIMRSQVAQSYRKGRVFLAGDAAHRFPPTGGLGMNTGMGEAYNLCWKIAACLQGWGSEALLDSYETECRPVAEANAAHSLNNSIKMFDVLSAIGLTGDKEKDRDALARFAEKDGVPAAQRDAIDKAVDGQIEHFITVGLDLGTRYHSPLLPDDAPTQPESTALSYYPTTRPGAPLPHIWLDGDRKYSSLDAISSDALTLVTGIVGEDERLAIRNISQTTAIPIHIAELGDAFTKIPDATNCDALLVRPDRCIAWRGQLSIGTIENDLATLLVTALGIQDKTNAIRRAL